MIKRGFTNPKLAECGGNLSREWYVGFRHSCPTCNVRKPYQLRLGLNYLKTAAERRAEGKAIEGLLLTQLKAGWNPHHQKLEDYMQRQVEDDPLTMSNTLAKQGFNSALTFALEQKKPNLALKSYQCFSTALKFAVRAAANLGMDTMPISQCEGRHIKALLAQMVRDRQKDYDAAGKGQHVTGNFYNKYRCYLACIFSELEEYEAVKFNPCSKIKDRPAITTNIHRHATQAEREAIKAELQSNHVGLWRFLNAIYYTGARPGELFGIRVGNVDMIGGFISLDAKDGGSKTRQSRRVPIPDEFLKLLKLMGLGKCPPDWYVFSEDFKPGAKRLKGFYASKAWSEAVHKELGIDVSLYSFKGLGGDDKREAGISLQAVSSQYGHSQLSTTMIYTHGEQARMDEELRKKTRAL